MKFSKKILAAFLAALMAISMMPFSAITAFAAADLTGNCGANGDNVTYRMQDTNNDGKYDKLTLSGSGAMADYADNYGGNRPWYVQGSTIYYYYLNTINIGDGITYIGENAFRALREVTNVTIPNTVTEIGDYAFSDEVKLESINIPTNLTTIGKYALSFCQKLPNITVLLQFRALVNRHFAVVLNLQVLAFLQVLKHYPNIFLVVAHRLKA